ncbi:MULTISPECIES: cupin domain-containing protein [Nitratireductor]|uniref:cupin domain-containing protein n=1 Tax=Nitratireductor TaxID=245876 RepID=UPI000D0CD40E|nr:MULTISPECIES: cupin domain-containing protein [Nitratireductor]PSM18778.1 cupin [Nitratireductor sp. StC3]
MNKHIIDFDRAETEPRETRPAAERILHGDPQWRSWIFFTDGGMTSGRWESTPGCWTIAYDKWEFLNVLEGRGRIRGDDGTDIALEPGATALIAPGFRGTWEVEETMSKHFFVRQG